MNTKILDTKKFSKYSIYTTDSELGKIKDFYFDEVTGHIRYLVVDTEKFLFRNLVLVSPVSIKEIGHDEEIIYLNIDKEKLENSPAFNSIDTISRLHEKMYNEYFAWPNYWESIHGPWILGPFGVTWHAQAEAQENAKSNIDNENLKKCHLHSLKEVQSYAINGNGQYFGHVQSLLFDNSSFKIEYFSLDTINFIPSKLVLLPFDKVSSFHWSEKAMEVHLSKEDIKNAPEYHQGIHGIADNMEMKDTESYYGT